MAKPHDGGGYPTTTTTTTTNSTNKNKKNGNRWRAPAGVLDTSFHLFYPRFVYLMRPAFHWPLMEIPGRIFVLELSITKNANKKIAIFFYKAPRHRLRNTCVVEIAL